MLYIKCIIILIKMFMFFTPMIAGFYPHNFVGGKWNRPLTTCKNTERRTRMHLMYYMNEKGDRIYTMKKLDPDNKPTFSAHPGMPQNYYNRNCGLFFSFTTEARFSPDDKFSRERLLLKKRFGLLPTQKPTSLTHSS